MIYLDNAATTVHKPPEVAQAVLKAMGCSGNGGRGGHGAALEAARLVYDTRVRLARLFGAEGPERIAFTMNATQSLNTALRGTLSPGDHVVTTALEHNSVLRPLYELEARGVELTVLPADGLGRLDYGALEAALRPNTRGVVCTHGSNLTGNLVDLYRVGEITRRHGSLLVVDASQTAGVFPIHVGEMGIDILCFTGHKSLMGPQGTGGLYVREGVEVRPLLSGGSGIETYSKKHPAQMPAALEAGTLNTHGIAGLGAALAYLERVGMEALRERELTLTRAFCEGAREIPGVRIYGDFSVWERCPIVALNLWDWDSAAVSDALFEGYGICTRSGGHCAPLMHRALGTEAQGAVRFSFSHCNTMDEVEAALAALRELAAPEG